VKYRNQKNAEAVAKYWNKPLDKADWYKIQALADDETEVMIYDYIGWPFNDAGEFIRALNGIISTSIKVRINSPGGDVFDGLAIFNALQSHKAKVITRIDSLAASTASFIAMAGKEVQAYQNAMLMIHNSLVYTAGNQYDLREIADLLEKIDGNMVDIYTANSSVGKKEIKEMMKAETWLTAKEAKEKGFIDTILDGKGTAKAAFDLSIFANYPECLTRNIDNHHEPTEREIEKALRDVGVSQNKAKAMIAGSKKAEGLATEEIKMICKEFLNSQRRF
jgi:ATP-dependent Clp endopeptidase proteolytic subunit ClpP